MSEAFIGLTIVAMGTSMPEFAVSIMSIIKKKKDLAIGNIVGANTLNALWALGFDTAFLRPLPFDGNNMVDMYMAFGVAFFLWLFMYIGKKYELERWQGAIFVAGFIAYVTYKYISLPKP
jgi:cation:H+ antiporter